LTGFKKNISFLFGLLFLTFLTNFTTLAQNTAIIYGKITDADNRPVELVNISVLGLSGGTMTDKNGSYKLFVPANKKIIIAVSFIGYNTEKIELFLKPDEKKQIDKLLTISTTQLPDVEVKEQKYRESNLILIKPKTVKQIPSISGGVEAIIKTLPGVSSNTELSSQYSVRGGNYDENLVYVNDIEIYRPFLIRSGQQEGLSFVNSDLISSILFSAGGFDAKYGDKMSSVLDIKYKKPKKFAGSVSASLLGGSAHIENISRNKRLSYLIGIRQKSNQYILKQLDTKGDYKPSFTDVQTYVNYKLNKKWDIDFLANYARNSYKFIPHTRETDYGTVNEAYRLVIYFDGQETDNFETFIGAFSTTYKPNNNLKLKFITSAFKSYENENYDIQGQYQLGQLENDFGKEGFGEVAFIRGVGTFLNHARNNLNATVFNIEHKGIYSKSNNCIQWGIKYQLEKINDNLNEWKMLDSSGYSIPHSPDSVGYTNPDAQYYYPLELNDAVNTSINMFSNRYSGFIQNTFDIKNDSTKISLIAGVRANYWDFNNQFLLGPRATISYKPDWEKDIVLRFSSGYYYQPPFYRELRNFNGEINKNAKAQTSIHFVAASDWDFKAWHRPFKFVTEIYYKHLYNLIPYEIDNVRVQYYANAQSNGYATGIDLRINGNFVKGIESWASLSVMKTQEDIQGDYYYEYFNKENELIIPGYTFDHTPVDSIRHEPGYIPRPTDQRVNFSMFFQDYLPMNPTYKVHLNFIFGTGLPFGPLNHKKYQATLRTPPYRRVDIGFSKQIKSEEKKLPSNNIFKNFKSIWICLEVFNLLQIDNTISYIWITDVTNRQYAVPNYLTPRQINIKISTKF